MRDLLPAARENRNLPRPSHTPRPPRAELHHGQTTADWSFYVRSPRGPQPLARETDHLPAAHPILATP